MNKKTKSRAAVEAGNEIERSPLLFFNGERKLRSQSTHADQKDHISQGKIPKRRELLEQPASERGGGDPGLQHGNRKAHIIHGHRGQRLVDLAVGICRNSPLVASMFSVKRETVSSPGRVQNSHRNLRVKQQQNVPRERAETCW